MYKKKVEVGQSLIDLCMQEYGDIRALYLLLEDNPNISLSRLPSAGTQVNFRNEIPNEIPLKKENTNYFRKNRLRVNTHNFDQPKIFALDYVGGTTLLIKGYHLKGVEVFVNGSLQTNAYAFTDLPLGLIALSVITDIRLSTGNYSIKIQRQYKEDALNLVIP